MNTLHKTGFYIAVLARRVLNYTHTVTHPSLEILIAVLLRILNLFSYDT
jgi:hypothetical protein